MPIRSIDAVTGVDSTREARALQPTGLGSRRFIRQDSGTLSVGAEPEKQKADAQKQTPAEQAKQLVQSSTSLRFKVDQDSGKTVAELLDPDGQVLRQMPTEEALEVAKAIGKFQGAFVNLKV
jgi:flagellar protein FlaG